MSAEYLPCSRLTHRLSTFCIDLKLLSSLLHATAHDMTRWDVYVAEVNSGHLQWGMLHTEKFFKENAKRMEGPNTDFAIVKVRLERHSMPCVCFLRAG